MSANEQCMCDICSKPMRCGEAAYATTRGVIDGRKFSTDSANPHLTVACRECGKRISEKIIDLMRES